MKTTLIELRTIIKDIILEELENDFDIPLPILRVKEEEDVPENFTGIAKKPDGTKEWYRDGLLHREGGPAIEGYDGSKCWFKDGKRHREDGPAVEFASGTKHWYKDGLLHREDGPAVIYPDGTKKWYKNNKLHREDGPAVEEADGRKEYWLNNIIYSKEEYEKIISKKSKRI